MTTFTNVLYSLNSEIYTFTDELESAYKWHGDHPWRHISGGADGSGKRANTFNSTTIDQNNVHVKLCT